MALKFYRWHKSSAYAKNRGDAWLIMGRTDEAISFYKEAIARDPTSASAHSALGNALFRAGRRDEAITACRKSIEPDPQCAKTYIDLAIVVTADDIKRLVEHSTAYNPENLQEGIKYLRRAVEVDPSSAAAHRSLGFLLYHWGMNHVPEMIEEAIKYLRKSTELDPGDPASHKALGDVLYDKGLMDEAITYLRRSIELTEVRGKHSESNEAYKTLAYALYDQGRMEEAISYFRQAIEQNPTDEITRHKLRNALVAVGRNEDSLAVMEKSGERTRRRR